MKSDTHPTYTPAAKVTCACGKSFTLGSTKSEINVEICSNCHPFYTGMEKMLDAAGRGEKFKARSAAKKTDLKKKSDVKAEKRAKRVAKGPSISKKK
ncbi:MAG TPA: 50S ribosomal protein L31 [Candidatus Paceibacterota bacterium]|nr:50S ribosomal protein L31 [Candidatus Paceibacterota bacterium]